MTGIHKVCLKTAKTSDAMFTIKRSDAFTRPLVVWRVIYSWTRFSALLVLTKYCSTSSSLFYNSVNIFYWNSLPSYWTIWCSWGKKAFTLWFLIKLLNFSILSYLLLISPEGGWIKTIFSSEYAISSLNNLQLTFKYIYTFLYSLFKPILNFFFFYFLC